MRACLHFTCHFRHPRLGLGGASKALDLPIDRSIDRPIGAPRMDIFHASKESAARAHTNRLKNAARSSG